MVDPTDFGTVPLEPGHVHLWRIELNPGRPVVGIDLLDSEERLRAEALATPALRRRFHIAHIALRRILGGYLESDPGSLRFGSGPEGKPHGLGASAGIHFNLSHSGELALLAVTEDGEVGVDVEWIHRRHDPEALLGALHPDEAAAIRRLPAAEQPDLLFRIWTRKEAYLKATGRGIPSRSRSVAVRSAGNPGVLRDPERSGDEPTWSLIDLDCGEGYRGALAVQGPEPRIRFLKLPPSG